MLNVSTPTLSGGRNPTGNGVAARRRLFPWFGLDAPHRRDQLGTHRRCSGGINHRLNEFGSTYLGELAGSDFALSGCVGMLYIVAALQWAPTQSGYE